jgi:hypothetical protein
MRVKLLLSMLLIFAVAVPAHAKRPLERITVSGPDLVKPIELTDSLLLRLSNPWFGNFLEPNTVQERPPERSRVYLLTLYARLRGTELRPIYRFHYAPSGEGTPGLVYLPGKTDPGYRQNVSVILRPGSDGRWHRATRAWVAYFEQDLQSATRTHQRLPPNNELQRTRPAQATEPRR